MSNRKKRTKRSRPHDIDNTKKSPRALPEDEQAKIVKHSDKFHPNLKGYTGTKGKSQSSQNLRRGNR